MFWPRIGSSPAELVTVTFKLWGAAGGSLTVAAGGAGGVGNIGGHGGFVSGTFQVQRGTALRLQVGEGGRNDNAAGQPRPYPHGGNVGPGSGNNYANQGGGRSALFYVAEDHDLAIAVAGGGGGGGYDVGTRYGGSGGAGGGGHGEAGVGDFSPGGGTTSAGGTSPTGNGAAIAGGDSSGSFAGPGGGDGYYGGGAGGISPYAGGGGGSNFITSAFKATTTLNTGVSSALSANAPQNGDADYIAGIAQAVAAGARGGHGLAVITIDGVKTVYQFTGSDVLIKV